jgi:CubicO group peptidase (beta-lactamase class C family)
MTRYARLQLNDGSLYGKQLIAANALAETHRVQHVVKSDNSSIAGYGLGWEITTGTGGTVVGHDGEFGTGTSTDIRLCPTEKIAIVILSSGFPGGYNLNKALLHRWDDINSTGAVQTDWYAEIEPQILAALQPGSSPMNPIKESRLLW